MSMAGLSKSRLERMHHVLSGYVERQEMPGLVALVSHHDDVHVLFGLGNRHKEVSIEELGRARTRGPLHHPRTLAATGQHSSH